MVDGLNLAGCIVTVRYTQHTKSLLQHQSKERQNHESLFYGMQLSFVDCTETRTVKIERVELRHGRIETRKISVLLGSCLLAVLLKKWIGLDEGTIIKATTESVNKTTGEISSFDRYYNSSLNF